MPSEAYTRFRDAVRQDIDPLLSIHHESASAPGRPPLWRAAIRRSGIVLLCAALEACAEGVVVEGLSYMAAQQTPASRYPEGLKSYVLLREIKRVQGHIGLAEAEALGELRDYWMSDEIPPVEKLPLVPIQKEFDNPTVTAVDWLMALLDYEEFVRWRSIRVDGQPVDSKARLEELVRRRNEIAHGDPQTPSIETVESLRSFALRFALQIDRRTRETVAEAAGSQPWD